MRNQNKIMKRKALLEKQKGKPANHLTTAFEALRKNPNVPSNIINILETKFKQNALTLKDITRTIQAFPTSGQMQTLFGQKPSNQAEKMEKPSTAASLVALQKMLNKKSKNPALKQYALVTELPKIGWLADRAIAIERNKLVKYSKLIEDIRDEALVTRYQKILQTRKDASDYLSQIEKLGKKAGIVSIAYGDRFIPWVTRMTPAQYIKGLRAIIKKYS